MSQADSQFKPAGQPAHPGSQFGSTRAISDVNFNRSDQIRSTIAGSLDTDESANVLIEFIG